MSIAIIGVGLALPDADSLDALHANLFCGHSSVRAPSAERALHSNGAAYAELGYLDRIDLFDHRFFGISRREAELMDPHQRMSLQLVHAAIENAGYAPGALRGSRTAVIISAPRSDYPSSEDEPQSILGTLASAAAARIAYLFDLRGPVKVVDTACSGSLVALAAAVQELRSGRVDLAVSGGLSVQTSLPEQDYELRGVLSSSGRCRPFDAGADGAVGGEGGGFVLLKRLSAALADGDHIHGVLRGIAVNHNGFRATNMGAPDQNAQAEVITAAWRDAGVDAVEHVECHGSGTSLGDVVEIAGLRRGLGDAECTVGAVKSNLGHLDHASGMAGLFKILAGARHDARYATVNFETPNPMIDFGDRVRVSTESGAGAPQLSGLSSFGLTGTNAHAVVECPAARPVFEGFGPQLITLSAKTPESFARYWTRLRESLDGDLASIAHVLNRGRDDHPYRRAYIVDSATELVERFQTPAEPVSPRPVVFLFSGDAFPADVVRRQYELATQLRALGVSESRMVGSAGGNLAVRVLRGQLALDAAQDVEPSDEVNLAGLERAVRGFLDDNAVLVEIGPDGVLSRRIAELVPDLPIVTLAEGPLQAVAQLYELGVTIDWERHYEGARIPRIELPGTVFEPVSCWTTGTAAPAPTASKGVEEWVIDRWRQLLKADDVHAGSNYFELGGTSIAGITVLREVEQHFGVPLAFADLYEHPTARKLAALIEQRTSVVDSSEWTIPLLERGGRLPLSFNQEQLWYLDRLNPGSPLYNIPADLRYRGPLDVDVLRAALRDFAQRHEVLRTRIPDDDGLPYVVADHAGPDLRIVDVGSEDDLRRAMDDDARQPFDLATGPLARTTLFRLTPEDHVLQVTWHHIVFDGWTPAIFLRDLSELYQSRVDGRAPKLPSLPVQYADFAAWQRSVLQGERLREGLRYWESTLADIRARELPLDRPRPEVQSFAGGLLEFVLDPDDAVRLREFSKAQGVTTFVTMLAAVDALLYLWAGQEDVVVGSATTGRTNPSTHELVGYFNNLLPFRTRVDGAVSFRELVRRCSATVTGALDHEEVPLSKIVSHLGVGRDASRQPLFTVAYTHQNTATHSGAIAGLELAPSGLGIAPGTSKFDLTLGVADQDGGEMRGYLEYAADLFDESTMRRVAELFARVVTAAMANPSLSLDSLLDKDDRQFWELVRAHAEERPAHPAVVDGRPYTYAEIDALAGRLAARLLEAGVRPSTPIPVLAERGVELVVGWLGVMRAGAAFVPVDPANPAARIATMLDEIAGPVVVVGSTVPCDRASLPAMHFDGPIGEGPRSELAYVAYTSGSTGHPHGCEIERRSLQNLVQWYGSLVGMSNSDRTSQVFAAGFDAAILEILSSLYHGATVHVLREVRQAPATLLRWLADNRITVAILPTPLAEVVLDEAARFGDFGLRVMCTGGDRLRVRPAPGLPFRLLNLYGPTECTVAATAGEVGPSGGLPDIGFAIRHARAYVLDPQGRPSTTGELYLGGAVVGRGYRGLPGLTATRFVADPFGAPGSRMYRTGDLARISPQGTIEFLGRADAQLEVRGHRVEPAEIERVLVAHPSVRECVVTLRGSQLVAHVVADGPTGDLISWVARELPSHMVPAEVVVRDELPKTINGKLDRKRLGGTTVTSPERVLGQIWAELLGRDTVAGDDDFFAIGGDSVLSVAVAGRAARHGIHITPQDVLTHPRLRDLASLTVPLAASAPERRPAPVRPTPIIHSFLERMRDPRFRFTVIEDMEVAESIGAQQVRAAVERLVELHSTLRYRFRRNAIGWRIEEAPVGEFFDSVVLPPMVDEVPDADKVQLAEEIDIERGPILRVRYYDRGHRKTGLLLFVVHHFVYDAMSLVPILEDLNALLTGRTVEPAPDAWEAWSAHVHDMASSDVLAGELGYWTGVVQTGSARPSILDSVGGPAGHVVRTIPADQVAPSLRASGAEGREVAVSAAAVAVARWRGESSVYLFNEGQATPNGYRPDDRSRSVGWFTTAHPVLLPVDPTASVTEAMPSIVDTLRSVPNDGVGYGILRHLSHPGEGVTRLRSFAEPEIFVEHTAHGGESMNTAAKAVWMRTTPLGFVQNSVTQWASLAIASAIVDGALVVLIAHDGRFGADDIDKLAAHVKSAFLELKD
ncbi:amino acid adenylation domain-containing protein [Allokutzneria sp. A3M-2-11 16]|uniref:non-ribosomal peptide synthetase n=1 Tax=Allokutzneria sp. A3M-2-11 16 TaxID=2962043 RepID=UPI0020B67F30|nr:non-ribosomal peptide synthetase [Allokutzneria sp. A3M-2-11 16]MCP3802397.1 amino acid adenylation domain-containing protein [Allokutzneria sp. A3M-2-11 16]